MDTFGNLSRRHAWHNLLVANDTGCQRIKNFGNIASGSGINAENRR